MPCVQLYSIRYTALQTCKKILCLNSVAKENKGKKSKGSHTCTPIINHAEVAIMFIFQLCSARYTALQANGSHFMLSQIETCVVSEKNCNKGGQRQHHGACYVDAAGGEKARFEMKQC